MKKLLLLTFSFAFYYAAFSSPFPGGITINLVNQQNPDCNGLNNGSITIQPYGGTAPYTYSWSPSGGTDSVATGLSAGTYTVTVTDAALQTATMSFTLTDAYPVTYTVDSISVYNGYNLSCFNAADGWVYLTAAGGYPGNMDSIVFNYTGVADTFIVPQGVNQLKLEVWGAQGGANWVNNNNFGGYSYGTYSVNPGDTLFVYVGQQPSGITGGWNGGGNGESAGQGGGGGTDIRIGGQTFNDRIIVAGGGGGAGYWSNLHVVGGQGGGTVGGNGYRDPDFSSNPGGEGATQSTGGPTGTCVNYNVTACAGGFGYGGVPSGCGCEGYGGGGGWYGGAGSGNCRGGGGGSGYIGGVMNGTMQQGVRTGHGMAVIKWAISNEFTYQWNTGDTTSYLLNANAGNNVITITDVFGCSVTDTIELTQPSQITVTAAVTDEVSGNDGAIDLTVAGGVQPYVFAWSNGATTEDITGLTAGTYIVAITDSLGCTGADTLTVVSFVGVNNMMPDDLEVGIYPNPSQGIFNLSLNHIAGEVKLYITDMQGKRIYAKNLILNGDAYLYQVDLAHIPAGNYLVYLYTDKGNRVSKISISH